MLATANSESRRSAVHPSQPVQLDGFARAGVPPALDPIGLLRRGMVVLWMVLLFATVGLPAEETPGALARAEQAFRTNRSRFQADRSNVEAAWQFARACFDLAEFASDNDQREEIARQGIDAARRALAGAADAAAAHYYLALNLGQLARTKSLGALKLVQEMEHEFKTAIQLDEKYDYAGSRRSLGLLYRDAPGWPTSIGNKSKARTELQRAVELFPEYPDNRLCLAESYAKWGERRALQGEIDALAGLLPKARQEFTGEMWATSWADWNERWAKLERARDRSGK